MYRDRLTDEAPEAATELDGAMRAFGQSWIIEGFTVDPEELVTVRQLAEIADVPTSTVRNWVTRWPLTCRGTNDAGHLQYRWGDVLDRLRQQRR